MTAAWCKERQAQIRSHPAWQAVTTALFELALEDKATDKVKPTSSALTRWSPKALIFFVWCSPVFTADEQTKALQHCWQAGITGIAANSSCSWRANGASSPYARWLPSGAGRPPQGRADRQGHRQRSPTRTCRR